MQLGMLMRQLEDDAGAARAIDALGDIILFSRVEETGRQFDETPGIYLANASRRFSNQGSDEDWLALMTAIEKADDPAQAVIAKILDWALAKDTAPAAGHGCGCGAGGCHGG